MEAIDLTKFPGFKDGDDGNNLMDRTFNIEEVDNGYILTVILGDSILEHKVYLSNKELLKDLKEMLG